MSLTEYETTVVLRADIAGEAVEITLDKVREAVRSRGGKLVNIEHWGKKKLAYEIDKHTRGTYVRAHYLGANQLVHEIERNLRISDTVLRFLTISLAANVGAEERQEQEYVRPSYEEADEAEAVPSNEEAAPAADAAPAAAQGGQPAAKADTDEPARVPTEKTEQA